MWKLLLYWHTVSAYVVTITYLCLCYSNGSTSSFLLKENSNICLQLAMSAHENATPIRILHNSAGHLAGSARSLGAVLMGYLGKSKTSDRICKTSLTYLFYFILIILFKLKSAQFQFFMTPKLILSSIFWPKIFLLWYGTVFPVEYGPFHRNIKLPF